MNNPYQNIDSNEEDFNRTKHYHNFLGNKQWIELIQDLPTYRDDPDKMLAALELQVRKYLDRRGRKEGESSLKDLKKARDYLNWMIQLLEEGRINIK